jgi:hypothetical protein
MKHLRLSVPVLVLLIGAAIFVAVQREPATAQARRSIVWDYSVIKVPAGDSKLIESRLQKAGAEGWECVSLSFSSDVNKNLGLVILKRQR